VSLDGAYVSAPRGSALDFSKDFTVTLWVNYSIGAGSGQQQTLVSDGNDGLGYMDFAIDPKALDIAGNDRLAFSWGGANAANGIMTPVTNILRQVAARRSGTNMTVFLNGYALTNNVSTVAPSNSPTRTPQRFGSGDFNHFHQVIRILCSCSAQLTTFAFTIVPSQPLRFNSCIFMSRDHRWL
jgi:hypothetical protein